MLVSIVQIVIMAVATLVLYYMVRKFKWNPQSSQVEKAKKRNLLSLYHVKDSLVTFFKPRPGMNRLLLWVLVTMFLLFITPMFGEGVISYLYTYTRYHWEVDQYSTYQTVTNIIRLVGMTVFVPILNKLSVNEAYILIGVFTSSLARNIIKGLAAKSWMYYLGKD